MESSVLQRCLQFRYYITTGSHSMPQRTAHSVCVPRKNNLPFFCSASISMKSNVARPKKCLADVRVSGGGRNAGIFAPSSRPNEACAVMFSHGRSVFSIPSARTFCVKPRSRSQVTNGISTCSYRLQHLSSPRTAFCATAWSSHRQYSVALNHKTDLFVSQRASSAIDTNSRTVTGTANDATEDSEAYRCAMPFEDIPTTGGLSTLPYIGLRLLFKPFSKYDVYGIGHVLCEQHQKLGPIYRWRHKNEWMVQIERIEDVEPFLLHEVGSPYRTPINVTQVYNKRSKIPSWNLTVLNGEEWRRLRTPMNAKMNRTKSLVHYLSSQVEVAEDFAEKLYHLRDAPAAQQTALFFKFATECAGMLCFNKRLGFLSDESQNDPVKQKLLASYQTNTRCVAEAMFGKRVMYLFYEDSFFKEYRKAKEYAMTFSKQCFDEAMEEMSEKEKRGELNPDEPSFLMSLLAEKTLTPEEVFSVLDTVMSAGSDSSACALQLLFYALATNPEQQERLADELLSCLGHDGHLTQDLLDNMPFLKATIQESLRLFFPTPAGIRRRLTHNAVMNGYQIPNGTLVGVNSMRIATSPDNFYEPMSFLPERWLRDEEGRQRIQGIHPLAYLPFGFGPRKCVGQRVALQELYASAASVVKKFSIGLQKDSPELETIFTPFRKPKYPLHFSFTPRSSV